MVKIGFAEDLHDAVETHRAGTAAFGLWVRLVCWSVRQSADGAVPREVVTEMGGARLAGRLVAAGLLATDGRDSTLVNGTSAHGEPYWRVKAPASRARIPAEVRLRIYNRDGWACQTCGTTDGLSLDHIHPRSKGGLDAEDNLRVLCVPCNSSKGARVE